MDYLNLLAVLFIVALNTRKCHSKWSIWTKELDWWQNTILYQIYPRSFQDSDGDGAGDLKGIESRLDHLTNSGIDTVWLSPFYVSPMSDLGYDISNYTSIDPMFGTKEDFESLVRAFKSKNIKMIMDLVPNHSSSEHEWFKKSVKGIKPYKDYYMWHPGKVNETGQHVPPNNWVNIFGGSAWTWSEERQEFFFHQFNARQPDFNLSNPNVQREFKAIMKYWLDLGCDGFRVDAVKHSFEDPALVDEECLQEYPNCDKQMYLQLNHSHTTDWPTTYDMLCEWRAFLDNYAKSSKEKHTRVLVTETYTTIDYTMRYYGNKTHPIAHMPFNFKLVLLDGTNMQNASFIVKYIKHWYDHVPEGGWSNWVVGNHDNSRVATRFGNELVDAFFFITMLLPGTAVTYQGEEIGQPDNLIRPDQVMDPNNNGGGMSDNRDPQRGPFLWNGEENAGFTTSKYSWEPIHPSYWEMNLEAQKQAKNSHYKIYQKVSALRKKPTFQRGSLQFHEISKWVFAFSRRLPGNESYVVVLNIGSEEEVIHLYDAVPLLPEQLSVVTSSINSGYEEGALISTKSSLDKKSSLLMLRPKASVVLSTQIVKTEPNTPTSASWIRSPDVLIMTLSILYLSIKSIF